MAVTTTIKALIRAIETGTGDLATPSATHELALSDSLASGTSNGQADKVWSDARTLTASASEALDLTALSGGALGATVAFAEVVAILIRARDTNTNSVEVTRTATTGAPLFMADGDGISLGPGQWFMWADGFGGGKSVTDTTDDTITVTNSAGGTSVVYDIVIVGRSA
jgi:hypothetical protein